MSTFKELQDEVLAHGFNETYRTRVKQWLNLAQARIARTLEVSDKFSSTSVATVIGTSTYVLPSTATIVQGVVDEALGFRLEYIKNPDDLMARNAVGTFTGRPIEYSFGTANLLLLSPVPDAVYSLTVLYFLRPVDLSADSDVSTIPADFHDVMVSWTLARAYRSEDDAQMSQFYMAEYQRDLMLLGYDTQVLSTDPTQVPGTWTM